ncbi:MAG: hypothetical protein LUD00_03945, partial [Prevotellaceae bacterium]|nr:hypothetical protein [Prevotellaceae bacterium]
KQYINICVMAAVAAAMVSCENMKSDGVGFKTVAINDMYKLDAEADDNPLGYEITTDMMFLQAEDENRKEVCEKINKCIISEFLNQDEYETPEEAIRKYIDEKIESYKLDVADVYKEEMQKNKGGDDGYFYASFNHNTHLKGVASRGFDGIINYSLTEDSYSGGAHPVSYTTMMCFSVDNGERVHLEDVFCEGSDKKLVELLTDELMKAKKVNSVDELKKRVFLSLSICLFRITFLWVRTV